MQIIIYGFCLFIVVCLAKYLSIASIKQSRFFSQHSLPDAFTTKKSGLIRRGIYVYLMDFDTVGVSTCLTKFCLKKLHVTFTIACNRCDNLQQTPEQIEVR
jgi:hypothetical protein